MSLTKGQRLAQYEVLSPLGSGGMGEVYRARDLRLDREVAIKVMAEHVAADPEMPCLAALQLTGYLIQVCKERLDEGIQFFSFGRQLEWAPLKKRHAQKFFQLQHLCAYGRLLDAVRDVPHRRHDAAVLGDKIKQFKVMNIHSADNRA